MSRGEEKMRLEFLGAAGTVTGSRNLIRKNGHKYLVDCGLFQGPREIRERNWAPFPLPAREISALVLTHAHLDHSGFVPRLAKEGFTGPVYCSQGTAELCEILWLDSARIQEEDADYANRTKHSRHSPALPLYNVKDAKKALNQLKPVEFGKSLVLDRGLSVVFRPAGHIVGASFLEIDASIGQKNWRLCFSGDLGHNRSLTLREPQSPSESEFLLLESTYGGREHSREDSLKSFAEHINATVKRGGVLAIPSFAVGRAQELLYMIRLLEDKKVIPSVPVLLDSPMASKATQNFLKHKPSHKPREDFDEIHEDNFFPRLFERIESPDDSFASCMREGPMIVIAGAGMLNGGRILHHLKSRLPVAKNRVLFVGHQAKGSKGHFLQTRGEEVGTLRVHHKEIQILAEIRTLETLSAHGDQKDLMEWLKSFPGEAPQVFLNHGEIESALDFVDYLKKEMPSLSVSLASEDEAIEFTEKQIRTVQRFVPEDSPKD